MRTRRFLTALVATALVASASWAGTPSAPVVKADVTTLIVDGTITDGTNSLPGPPLEVLTKTYRSGRWATLQIASKDLLKEALKASPTHTFDSAANWYLVVFVATDSGEKPELIRYLVHDPIPAEFSLTLPGLEEVYQVFLSGNLEASYATKYDSERSAPPLAAQIPKFVGQFDPSVLTGLLQSAGGPALFKVPSDPSKPRYAIRAIVSKVQLPFARSTVTVTETLTVPHVPVPKALVAIGKASDVLVASLAAKQARLSECARGLAKELDDELDISLSPGSFPECKVNSADTSSKCWATLGTQLGTRYGSYMSAEAKPNGKCEALGPKELEVVLGVDTSFRALAAGKKPAVASTSFKVTNRPLTRYSLGLVNAFITDDSGVDDRAKLADTNMLVADPIGSGPLVMGVVNFHPNRYDPDTPKMTPAERYRGFVGVSFSPEFGIAGGFAIGLVRGLSLNLGYALLVVDEPRSGEALDVPLMNEKDPLTQTTGGVVFVGLGYTFGG